MWFGLYVFVGLIAALVVLVFFHRRVSDYHRPRLFMLAAITVFAWLGMILLALADTKRTAVDYVSQWLERPEE